MKILLLEDDLELCKNIKISLEKENYMVDCCNDGETAMLYALNTCLLYTSFCPDGSPKSLAQFLLHIRHNDRLDIGFQRVIRLLVCFADWICPQSMEFSKDCFKINERFGRVLYMQDYASYVDVYKRQP